MLDASNETPQSGMRTYVLISTVVFILALAYVGWVFWSRAHQDKMIEQRAAEQRQAQEKSQDAQAVTATIKDGVLTVTLPKAKDALPRQIPVRAS